MEAKKQKKGMSMPAAVLLTIAVLLCLVLCSAASVRACRRNSAATGSTSPAVKVGTVYSGENLSYRVTGCSDQKKTAAVTKGKDSARSVTIPDTVCIDGATYDVTAIEEGAFSGCRDLKTVKIGSNVTKIGKKAFYRCTNLTKVGGCSAVTSVGSKAFYHCTNLTQMGTKKDTISLPKVKTIGSNAFGGCKSVREVNLTSGALTTIGDCAFQGCTAMTDFTSKSTKLKSIGKKAFYQDQALSTVTLKSTCLTQSGVKEDAFRGVGSHCMFRVPSDVLPKGTRCCS